MKTAEQLRLVTCRESPAEFKRALQRQPGDIKVGIQFAEAQPSVTGKSSQGA